MAKFHSVAYAFNAKNPQVVKNWNLTSYREKLTNDPGSIPVMETSFDNLIKDLEKENLDLAKSAFDLKKRWLEVYQSQILIDRRFISHGDLWLHNIMINDTD